MTFKHLFYRSVYPINKYLGTWGRKHGISMKYFWARGNWPNLDNPKNLSEKVLSLMCKPEFLSYADLADKVKVHEFIRRKGLDQILLKHYQVWDSPFDITNEDIAKLPDKFILKPNNGSGGHVYCRDKNKFELSKAQKTLQTALDFAHGYFLEPHSLVSTKNLYIGL